MNKLYKIVIFTGIMAAISAYAGIVLLQAETVEYKIGVLSSRGESLCLKQWAQTARYLTNKLEGVNFKIVPLNFSEVRQAVADEKIDFILTNPAIYVEMEIEYGVERIATIKRGSEGKEYTLFGGTVFTRQDNKKIQQFNDIRGKRIMGVDENSFGGWIAARREFWVKKISPATDCLLVSFGGTNDAVVYEVRDGGADVGVVKADTLEQMAREGKIDINDFKVIHEHEDMNAEYFKGFPFLHSTRLYPEWPFAKLKHTSCDIAEKITIALLSIEPDHLAAITGKYAGWTVPLNYQSVHECLKELRIGPYRDFGKITLKNVGEKYWPWISAVMIFLILMGISTIYTLRLNRRLANSETRFKQIAENSQEWIWEVDISGLYTYSNPMVKNILGYLPEEIIGKKYFYDFFIPQERENLKQKALEAFTQKISFRGFVNNNINKNGEVMILETNALPLINERGELIGYRGVDVDITERKKTEQALQNYTKQTEEVNKELDDFTYIISHDLKEPLRSIHAFSKFVLQDYADKLDEEGKNYLSRIQANTEHMQELIDDLLEISRIERQKNIFEETETDKMVSAVIDRLDYTLKQKNIEVIIQGGLPKVYCDRIRLTEVFANLLSNAVKFLDKEKAIIEVGCRKKEPYYEFYVKDNGLGIEEMYFDKIFGIFQRLGKSEEVEGAGAGLTIVKKIVEMHKGSVRLESKIGEGTTFYFTIPIDKDFVTGRKKIGEILVNKKLIKAEDVSDALKEQEEGHL
ncbi:MAG: PhnD/SsuA/transferrin family substrate-binding protein [Candidatus Omnitrophota bacterium]